MFRFFNKIFKDPNQKILDEFNIIVQEINSLEAKYEKMSDNELSSQTNIFKEQLSQGKSLDDILPQAFAVVRETAKRVMGLRHYDVQIMGGIALHRGMIAEMKTGEGKTLTSTLAIYLNALEGKGVHVVTVNDYLAARDTVWMGQIFDFLGLTVSCIQNQGISFLYDKTHIVNEEQKDKERDEKGSFKIVHDYLRECSRKQAYEADITYGTNNEFGFDYLRDNMAQSLDEVVQRELNYAVIDEIDSILIDEARTPLIISAPAEESTNLYKRFAEIVKTLKENEDYNIDEKMRTATLTEQGIKKVEKALNVENIYVQGGVKFVHHLEQALKAHTLFKRDRDYVVKDGQIIIVDEFTGRLMPGRRYSEGLHQAIEAKEGVEIQRESQTLATITFQNLFRLYKKLSGMTGTAATEAEEFSNIYKLDVVVIPTNKPVIRKDLADKVFKNERGKFKAIVRKVKELYEKGQPVLIGTISIEKNELLAEMLKKNGIPCQILNAKNHEKEAEIIAQAGKFKAVTVATNMAGRGVDIILGGNPPDKKEAELVRKLGGLFVLGTERHESRRIDNQLRGRSGRQGDPGCSQFFISMDDDVMRIFGSDRMKAVMEKLGLPEDMPIENKFITKSIESAQKRVEGHNFDIRKHVLEYDDVLNKHRITIYKNRRKILESENVKPLILKMLENEIEQIVSFHTASDNLEDWDVKEILEISNTIFNVNESLKQAIESTVKNKEISLLEKRTKIIDELIEYAKKQYNKLEEQIKQDFNDLNILREIEKTLLLRTYDTLWVEHLNAMNHLRLSIGLQGYGQRDPLVEYKKQAFQMFNELQNLIQRQVVYTIFKVSLVENINIGSNIFTDIQYFGPEEKQQFSDLSTDPYEKVKTQSNLIKLKPKDNQGKKIGRNDPCPCGSGKKYKKCCGR